MYEISKQPFYVAPHQMCFGTGRRYCITKDGIPYLTVDTVETYHQMHLPCCIYRNQLYIADYWNLHQIDLDTLAHCVREDIKFFYFGYFEPLPDQLLFSTDSDVYALDGSGKILWHTENLAIDGITFSGLNDNGKICISCCFDPLEEWHERLLDLKTGRECT